MIDASVAVKWFLEEDRAATARELLERADGLLAPSFILLEVTHAMWVAMRQRRTTRSAAIAAEQALPGAFRLLAATEDLFHDATRLMHSVNHPVYDCLYLALAEREALTLLTADKAQFQAARRAKITTELL